MKNAANIIVIGLFLLFSNSIMAQKMDQMKVKKPGLEQSKGAKVKLCQLKMYVYPEGNTKIIVDFGNTNDMDDQHLKEIKLEGYSKDFDNMVDALRHMRKRDWRILETYEVREGKNKVIYFIMNRR